MLPHWYLVLYNKYEFGFGTTLPVYTKYLLYIIIQPNLHYINIFININKPIYTLFYYILYFTLMYKL